MAKPQSKVKRTHKTPGDTKGAWLGLKLSDLEGLVRKLRDKFKWSHSPRPFQLEAIKAQLLRKDVLIHAGTGSEKTAVAAGPHAHEKTAGMVTFMVSPLIALQDEQVCIIFMHPSLEETHLTAYL